MLNKLITSLNENMQYVPPWIATLVESDKRRYKDFVFLKEPVEFSILFKDIDFPEVQVHAGAVIFDTLVGFMGAFKWTHNTITPLDGESYSTEMLVYGFRIFRDGVSLENNLDILV